MLDFPHPYREEAMSKATINRRVREISSVREKIATRPSSERLLGRADMIVRDLDRLASRSRTAAA
jgi:hypothetical protein